MAKTYKQLRDALGNWLGANAVRLPDAIRGDCVNLAIRELCRLHDSRYNEVSDTLATVSGTASYALPATWSRPYQLWYLDPDTNTRRDLTYKSKEEFDTLYPDGTELGKPSIFTVWGASLLLAKTPDRVLTVHRDYYTILADLSADGDTNGFTTNVWEVVLFKALSDVSRYGVEDARIPVWQARARELEQQFLIEYSRGRSAGRRAESQEPG